MPGSSVGFAQGVFDPGSDPVNAQLTCSIRVDCAIGGLAG
jgi:hypothetical protein